MAERVPLHRGRGVGVGVDIGGSHVLAVATTPRGRVVRRAVRDRRSPEGVQGVLSALRSCVREVRTGGGISLEGAVGVAFPGAFEGPRAKVVYAPNLPEWVGVGASPVLSRALGVKVVLENDANAAAWAEHRLGPFPREDLLYVSLGTGVGSGIVLGDQLLRGPRGFAGEIGHVPVAGAEARCGCGRQGCLESVAGGRALAREAQRLAREAPRSGLARRLEEVGGEHPARELLWAAEEGDEASLEVRERAAEALGVALASAVDVLGVEQVALGGRLLRRAPGYFRSIRRTLLGAVLPPLIPRLRVRRASDWPERGAVGAFLVAQDLTA